MFDYETLRFLWWLFIGVLLIGFAIMDGFDLGVLLWLPWITRTDTERRILINSVGPTWEGNQVWLILGAGAIFAAWPTLYALSFSGFYLAMLLVLLALILRPVGFKYRSKLRNKTWRMVWDTMLFISAFVSSFVLGVAIGNVLLGVPFHFDIDMRIFYTGTFFHLFHPFACCCGLLTVLMFAMQGGFFLRIKTEGFVAKRARIVACIAAIGVLCLFIALGFWVAKLPGYVVMTALAHDGPSNPLYKEVSVQVGAWLQNYTLYPMVMLVPASAIFSLFLALLLSCYRPMFSFLFSSTSIAGIIGTMGVSMFPFLLPSQSHPGNSLLVWDSSSSELTLFVMFIVTAFFLPLICIYTAWVYRVLRGKVTVNTIHESSNTAY